MTIFIGIKDNTNDRYQLFCYYTVGTLKMAGEDEHVIEALGKTRIVVRDGKVVEVGKSLLKECPLAKKFAQPVNDFSAETIRANIESRIESVGMFTPSRSVTSSDDFVAFGASELIGTGIRQKMFDAAVIVCDGAGTVVVTSPELVQGIGGRMSGLVKTSPIKSVIKILEDYGAKVLAPSNATIDQPAGAELARKCGYQRIAVTVATPGDAEAIRQSIPGTFIFGVHLTGISKEGAERMVAVSDAMAGCASKWVREVAGRASLLQAGTSIPVFVLTKKGKELISRRVAETQQRLLIKVEKLPHTDGKCPDPLQ